MEVTSIQSPRQVKSERLSCFGSHGFGLTTLGAGDEVVHWLDAFKVVAAGGASRSHALEGALLRSASTRNDERERIGKSVIHTGTLMWFALKLGSRLVANALRVCWIVR